jgi:hypothetical protein
MKRRRRTSRTRSNIKSRRKNSITSGSNSIIMINSRIRIESK